MQRFKKVLLAAVITLLYSPRGILAGDAPAKNALAQMQACASENDDARRLACYDNQFRQLHRPGLLSGFPAEPGLTPAAPVQPSPAPESFGMTPELARQEQGAPSAPRPPDKLQGSVVSVVYKVRGEAVIRLDNGQSWEETEVDSPLELKPGDVVTIKRGTLGSFWLSSSRAFGRRVRRVR
jgi:hypothetical protein